ncbi:hypothetical protein JGH54_000614 [Listeria monocytogenes]|nr:hypothetical protein [Listeria monocytogenes]
MVCLLLSDGAELDSAIVARDLGKLAGLYETYKCLEAAGSMSAYLEKIDEEYEWITISYSGDESGNKLVYSESKGIQVSTEGWHTGIIYNQKVYCNIHPAGISIKGWIVDMYGLGIRTITPVKYNFY